jgi:hypothetical protein
MASTGQTQNRDEVMKELKDKLTEEFIRQMAGAGMPVDPVSGQQRALYRRRSDNTLIMPRTGENRQIQAVADDADPEARIKSEEYGADFVAAAMPIDRRKPTRGTDIYLIPAAKVFAAWHMAARWSAEQCRARGGG